MKLVSSTVDLSRARWRKSSFSGGGGSNCVEVADAGHTIAVRDSKDARGHSRDAPAAGPLVDQSVQGSSFNAVTWAGVTARK
jgi:hypothetical protein